MISTQVASAPNGGIPRDVFDVHSLPHHERFEVWRESVLPLFEPSLEDVPPEAFFARVDGFNLRRLVICLAEFSGQRYLRRCGHRADEGADHLLVQLYLTGGYVGHNGHHEVRVGPGDISLLDLGYSLETRAQGSSTLSVVVPRELMFSFLPPSQMSIGSVIPRDSAVGRVLRHHLTSVWRALHAAHAHEDERISQALIGGVAGAFAGYGANETCEAMSDRGVLDAICAYIDRNLAAGNLTPEHLCRRFGCSRARLHRLFRPLGGLAAYIRQARLQRCLYELSDPRATGRSVIEVAMRWGFPRQSDFCRLFRERFGMTPGEAIERARTRNALCAAQRERASASHPAFSDWIRQL